MSLANERGHDVDVMSSMASNPIRLFAVISVRRAPYCERMVIAYSDETALRTFLAKPSIVAVGYNSREEAERSSSSSDSAGQPLRRKAIATLVANGTQALGEFVCNHLSTQDATTTQNICRLLQQGLAMAVVFFYSKNLLGSAIRALISF